MKQSFLQVILAGNIVFAIYFGKQSSILQVISCRNIFWAAPFEFCKPKLLGRTRCKRLGAAYVSQIQRTDTSKYGIDALTKFTTSTVNVTKCNHIININKFTKKCCKIIKRTINLKNQINVTKCDNFSKSTNNSTKIKYINLN